MRSSVFALAALAAFCAFGDGIAVTNGEYVLPYTASDGMVRITPESGEEVTINDFNFIVVSKSDWYAMTNALAWLTNTVKGKYERDTATDSGRKSWHGKIVASAITNGMKTVTYQDGYTWSEKMVEFHNPITNRVKNATRPTTRTFGNDIPQALREIREKRKNQRPVEVRGRFSAGGKFKEDK